MLRSVGEIHGGAHAASGRPEPSRRHSRSLGTDRCLRPGGCKPPEAVFPYGVDERTSISRGYVSATESPRLKRAAAPSVHALTLRPSRRFGPISECRFHPLQIGVDIGHRCRALSVCCLRDLGINTGRYVGWILNPPRRSFKLRGLVDRQRPMKNVTLDGATVLQLDAIGTDTRPIRERLNRRRRATGTTWCRAVQAPR